MIVFDGFKILGLLFTLLFMSVFGLLLGLVFVCEKYGAWKSRRNKNGREKP